MDSDGYTTDERKRHQRRAESQRYEGSRDLAQPPEAIAGGQGNIHFSIIADPTNANIVYVGGDRQPRTFGDTGSFPNSIGAIDFTGRLFRGNAAAAAGSQWVHLTHSNSLGAVGGGTASSSSPHADSREMAFDANGNLIEVDDGGIYRRTNPQNNTGDWFSMNGNLQVTESHDVAYDSISNIIMSGNQDTGTTEQVTSGSQTWRSVTTGDGGDVAVDNITLAGSNRSIRYSSFQNFQQFRRRIVDNNNNVVSTVLPALTVTGGSPSFGALFDTPIVLNSVNPSRLILGGSNGLYESTNQGDTITRVTSAVIPPDGSSSPIAYGGRSGGIDNLDVVYAGANNGNIHIRTTAGGAFTSTDPDVASSDAILDVRLDSDQWQTAFAIDKNQVFTTNTSGAAWADITGNLPVGSVLRSLEFIGAAVDAIAVGTNLGVFVSLVTTLGTWVQFGSGLPNAPVWDMDYDSTDNVLVVGTLGRGVWTLANASQQLPGQGAATDDFGDAPSAAQSGFVSSYPVTIAENGARHTATGPRLGGNRDSEADGVHSALADADDTTGSPDDEDGVTISGTIIASKLAAATGSITVNLQNAGGVSNRLDAWIDFNRDGDWSDPGEQIFTNHSLGNSNGAQVLNFTIPQDTGANVEQGTSFARFRVSTAGGLGVTGAAVDGEVEDYRVSIASSAAFVVDTLVDESDGNFATGDFSLREAIELANSAANLDEIQFAPALSGGTITLTVGQLLVNNDLTITGPGAANLTISGGNAFRVFDLQTNPDVIISGLRISGGLTTGAVQLGAAVRSTGNLEIINSVVTNNSTTGSQSGGAGIFQGVSGTLRLTNSTVSNNTAPNFFSPGGGIYSQGDVIVTSSSITGNSTGGQFGSGAGILVSGNDLTITDSTVSNNVATGADSSGGGIVVANGNLNVMRSTISGNSTVANAGGIGFDSNGSAVTATIINSTISGNSAGSGGGIANFRGTLNLQHSTVTLNTAPANSGSGLASFSDGTLIANTVILSSIISANTNSDVDNILTLTGVNTITSSGFNLIGTGNATTSFNQISDLVGIANNPQLSPLAANGGPTLTHALLAGSAAIEAGNTTSTQSTDQRGAGFARVVGGKVDIGAYELQATNPSVTLSLDKPWFVEASGTATFTATLSQITAVNVTVNLNFTGTATGSGTDYNTSGTQIIIPAGTLSGTVTVTAVQDGLDDDSETIVAEITSVINGTESGVQQAATAILDDDVASLIVTINAAAVSEGAGAAATTATVTRNTSTVAAMTVNLSSSDTTEATVPASVVIPAGDSSVTFNINAVNDAVFDGTQTVTITATEVVASTMIPDSTFGVSGIVATDLRYGIQYGDPEMILQPDGRILSIGRHPTIDDSWQIVRLNTDGSFDASFGSSGIVITAFAGESSVRPTGIAVHPTSGKITVAGMSFAGSKLMVARYNSNGTLDATFGVGGRVVSSPAGLSFAVDVVLNADGSTFVTGVGTSSGVAVVKLQANGTLDSSFGVGGVSSHVLDPNYSFGVGDVAQQADGKIVITATGSPSSGNERFYVVRMNLDGTLDSTFDGDGYTLIDFGVLVQRPEAVKIQPDGKIVVTGRVEPTGTNNSDWATVRLNSNGSLDTTFSGDGKVTVSFASEDLVHDLAILPDGKILLVGGAFVSGNGRDRGFARLNVDGTLDNSFGTAGKFTLPPLPIIWEQNWDVAIQPDGKIVTLVGYLTNYQVERFQTITALTGADTLDVTDDDAAPSLSINDITVTEGDSGTVNAVFTVTLSAASGQTVTVDFATADGTALQPGDYASNSGTLTFAAGETTKTITVAVKGDLLDEVNETYFINLTNAANATISDAQGLGTITDDDATPSLSINDITVTEGDSGTVNAVFIVTLSAASGQTVTVDFATADGTALQPGDYTSNSGTLTFAPGETTKTITVAVKGDTLDEVNETYFINLTNAANATISDAQGLGTITDDDGTPTLSIDDITVTEGDAGTVNTVFTVTLSAASGQTVTVDFATADGTALQPGDYTSNSGTLTFAPGETTKTVTVAVKGDTLDEVNETYAINLTNATNATISDAQGQGTVIDDDATPSLSINDITVTEGDAGTVNAVFTVTLSAASGQTVTVDFATADGTALQPGDYTSNSGTLTFAPGETTRTITVGVKGDVLDEVHETYPVNLTNATNATISDSQGQGTITDDDLPALTVDVVATSVSEAAGAAATTVIITRNTDTTNPMVVNLRSSDTTESTIQATATIPAGQASITVNLDAVDDAVVDGTQTVTITATEGFTSGDPLADATFGTSGFVTTALRNRWEVGYLDIATQPDGKIIAIGAHETLTDSWRVVRLNSDGSPDTSFGTGGSVFTTFTGETNVQAQGIIQHDDGRITIVGHGFANNWLIARYTAAGAHDVTFSGDGKAEYSQPQGTRIYKGIGNTDGSIFVIGDSFGVSETTAMLGRIRNDGTLDPTFGTGGIVLPSLDPTASERPTDIVRQPDGKLVIAGYATYSVNVNWKMMLARFNPDGTLDNSFGTNGYRLSSTGDDFVGISAMALQNNGSIVVVGHTDPTTASNDMDWLIARFTTTGAIDTTFSGNGRDTIDWASGDEKARDVVIQPDGKIVVVGGELFVNGNGRDRAIARYNADGTLDTTFSSDGKHTFELIFPIDSEETWAATLQPDGRLVTLSGYATNLQVERWLLPGLGLTDSDTVDVLDNDSATVSLAGTTNGNEAGPTNGVFTVTQTAPAAANTVLTYSVSGTSNSGSDFTALSGTVTITAGSTSATIIVPVIDDALAEGSESVVLTLTGITSSSPGVTINGAANNDLINIIDNDPTPSLSINDITVTEGDAGTVNAVFTVTLSGASGHTVTADFATADGTALQPGDYTSNSGTLTFAPGETTKTVTVAVKGDVLDEANETYFINLTNAANATISDSQGLGTVTDDDGAGTLSINDITVTEGNSGTVNAVFTVTLSAASGQTVTVDFATADGTALQPGDYTSNSGTLTFAPGETTKTVTVAVKGDVLDEVNETYFINLTNAANATISDAQGLGTITDDDGTPTLSIDDITVTEGDAGTVNTVFTVTLSAASGQTVTVDFATADGTALQPGDYTSNSGTLTFAPGETTKTVTVAVKGDTLDEVNETYAINLTNATNATISDAQGQGTVIDDDATPSLSINDITVTEGDAGTVNAVFTVTLSAASGQTVTVDFATADGTALQPGDYTSNSGTLTFAPGETTRTITVAVNGDVLDEVNETYFINLTNAANATISDSQGLGTITDDDAAPSLSINDITVTEGNSGTVNAVFTVTLSAASGQTVTVDFATADGTALQPGDYTSNSGTLTFAPGETTKTVTVAVKGDVLDEANETYFINLTNAANATISDAQGLGTVTDDEGAPSLSINDITVTEGDSGTVNAVFTVTLSAASGQTVTVDFATADGTALQPGDYTSNSGTLTFAPGETTKTITVAVNGDVLDEVNETYFINLTNAANATISDSQGLGTVTDDDGAGTLSINDITVTEGNSGTVNAVFTVTLSAASGQTVTVDFATADGTALQPGDYTSNSGTLTFAPGETTKTVTVAVKGDVLDEVNETYFINLTNATNATISDSQGLGTITDDDAAPSLSINDITVTEGNSGTVNAVFTVTLSAASGQTVTVDFATADGSALQPGDYTSNSGTLTFAPGEITKTITVAVKGDTLDEVNETYFINLTNAANATISDAQGLGTITDDDGTPTLSINDITVTEGNSGTVNAVFTVTLSAASGQTVTVDFATADGTALQPGDYTSNSGTLTFAPGETTKTVTVAVKGDVLDEVNETYFINLTNATNATISDALGLGTVTDDDAAPTLSINDITVTEGDSGTVNAVFTVTLSAASGQTVTVDFATADGTALQPGDYTSNSGTLTFAPGEITKTVTVAVKGDVLDEVNETYFINLTNAANATISDALGLGTVTDDDAAPTLSINDITVTEGNAGTVDTVFTVTLSAASGQTVTVDFATADGTALQPGDYTSNSGTLTFAPGETTKTITVAVKGDVLDEANETYFINLSNAANATISDALGLGTVTDDDTANQPPTAVTLTPTSVSLAENASTLSATVLSTISVTDDGQGANVLSLSGADASSFEIVGNSLRLKAGVVLNFELKPLYSVTVDVDDASAGGAPDASATFTLNLTNVTELNGIDVQKGQSQRSFVRYLDILFDQGGSDLLNLISNNRLQLTRFDLDGNNGTVVPLPTTTAVGSQIQLDFGAQGIGGNRNTNVGDGYYQIAVDMDQNGSFETVKSFHRLLGDMNGNGIVDAADKTKILLAQGTPYSAENDANGDGAVNITDTSLVTRAFGRKLKNTLFPLDD
jgi:uncharacterized delta-60 repeat protein/CSLREA domain-containing protein